MSPVFKRCSFSFGGPELIKLHTSELFRDGTLASAADSCGLTLEDHRVPEIDPSRPSLKYTQKQRKKLYDGVVIAIANRDLFYVATHLLGAGQAENSE